MMDSHGGHGVSFYRSVCVNNEAGAAVYPPLGYEAEEMIG